MTIESTEYKTGRLIAEDRGGTPILKHHLRRNGVDPYPRKGRDGPVEFPSCCTRNVMKKPALIYAIADKKTICWRPGNMVERSSSLMTLNRLTTEEVAKVYCCNEHRVTWLRKQGLLPGVKFGKHYLYLEDDVNRLMRASTRHTVAELASMSPDALRNALEAHDD